MLMITIASVVLLNYLLSTFLHSECAKLGDYLAKNYIGLMCADKLRLSKSDLVT